MQDISFLFSKPPSVRAYNVVCNLFRWLSNEGEMSSAISFHNGTVFPCPARPCAHKFILWNNTLRKRHTRIHWLCNTTTENILSQIFWREDAHTHKNILFFLTDLKTVLFSRQMFTERANGETWGEKCFQSTMWELNNWRDSSVKYHTRDITNACWNI